MLRSSSFNLVAIKNLQVYQDPERERKFNELLLRIQGKKEEEKSGQIGRKKIRQHVTIILNTCENGKKNKNQNQNQKSSAFSFIQ